MKRAFWLVIVIAFWSAVIVIALTTSGCDEIPCPTVDCDCVNDTVYSRCRERENFYHNILILQGYFDQTCQVSSRNWQVIGNLDLNSNATLFEFRGRPKLSEMDGVIGFAVGNASGYQDLAAAVRFNSNGYIDVRDAAAYSSLTPYQYSPCENYRFQIRLDFENQTYSVGVDNGTTIVTLANAAAFRETTQNVTALGTLNQISAVGTQEVCIDQED